MEASSEMGVEGEGEKGGHVGLREMSNLSRGESVLRKPRWIVLGTEKHPGLSKLTCRSMIPKPRLKE